MHEIRLRSLHESLISELDNLQVKPQAIMMSPEFYKALRRPSKIRGVDVIVDLNPAQHWRLKF